MRRALHTQKKRKETQAIQYMKIIGPDSLIPTLRDLNGWQCPSKGLHFLEGTWHCSVLYAYNFEFCKFN